MGSNAPHRRFAVAEGHARGDGIDICLTDRPALVTVFQNCAAVRLAGLTGVSPGAGWVALRFARNEMGINSLKTNDCAKWPISCHQ